MALLEIDPLLVEGNEALSGGRGVLEVIQGDDVVGGGFVGRHCPERIPPKLSLKLRWKNSNSLLDKVLFVFGLACARRKSSTLTKKLLPK